ncbi:ABC transporter permease [Fervidibacillus albus]|uniref:ABC-2 family transporter protein n=1 Tax=Fervidibacillus albus TaxID=2980026 RepID=A0A9E8LT47_9BACI|nr:ABC-2 family transporter protein [Fervidibacillus albus]WAA09133.1 ABC-2 family transporter protein [Fervidibacillus albus]
MFGISRGFAYFLASFKISLRYRVNVWLQVLGAIILVSIQYFLWENIGNHNESLLNGIEVNSIMLYVIFSRLLVFIIPGNGTTSFISQKILKGTITVDLLRPVHIQVSALCHEFGKLLFNSIFILVPSILISILFLDIPIVKVDVDQLLLFGLSITLSYLLAFQMSFMIGVFSIWFGNVWGVREFYEALLMIFGGSLIPISLYPTFFQMIAIYSPFQSIYFTPLTWISNIDHFIDHPIVVQVCWLFIFGSLNHFLLRYALRKAVIQGG